MFLSKSISDVTSLSLRDFVECLSGEGSSRVESSFSSWLTAPIGSRESSQIGLLRDNLRTFSSEAAYSRMNNSNGFFIAACTYACRLQLFSLHVIFSIVVSLFLLARFTLCSMLYRSHMSSNAGGKKSRKEPAQTERAISKAILALNQLVRQSFSLHPRRSRVAI